MATQAMPGRSRDVHHGASNSISHSYPPLPGSPTLTNPDMILPDYDDDDDNHSDSPGARSRSPLTMWQNTQATATSFHLPQQESFVAGPTGITSPTTPIIYGNGTMLSDIGEVTEVESSVGVGVRRAPSLYSDQSDDEGMIQAATAIGGKGVAKKLQVMTRERRGSAESTSTITTQQEARGAFAEFDDSMSMDDSNFQGDDEESVADSFADDGAYGETPANRHNIQTAGSDKFSTNSISKRAEQILANAKRRLTTMEGNLTRARSSLNYSSMSDGSTPSPPMVRPATSLRETTSPLSPSHSRNTSENSIQGTLKQPIQQQRSASALGAAGGYRQPLISSKNIIILEGGAVRIPIHKNFHPPLDVTLESLSEDDDDMSQADIKRYSAQRSELVSPSPSIISYTEGGIPRAASVAQVRGLQEQMNGLKGKISSLKEQARADSMKRRSLQSLRTPSPFTHARWDQGFLEPRSIHTSDGVSTPVGNPLNGEAPEADDGLNPPADEEGLAAKDDKRLRDARYDDAEEKAVRDNVAENDDCEPFSATENPKTPADVDGKAPVTGIVEVQGLAVEVEQNELPISTEEAKEEEEEDKEAETDDVEDRDDESESGNSLYHDTYQAPISHEDREDAFDYEHFYLHSAMGNLMRQRYGRRDSDSGSASSQDSVETTRGPAVTDPRRQSMETVSSMDTFQTANEGRASRGSTIDGEEEDGINQEELDGAFSPKRRTFGGFDTGNEEFSNAYGSRRRQNSVLHRPVTGGAPAVLHRPSISSFESTGTNRSFPLVNKAKQNGDLDTPNASPEPGLQQVTESLMADVSSATSQQDGLEDNAVTALQLLSKDDLRLVERLVAGLGKCVLGLNEASRASTEGRQYRGRIDAARRFLEGLED